MLGWIIYTDSAQRVNSEKYELDRFLEEARLQNISMDVIHPDEISLLSYSNENEILTSKGYKLLPDFVINRMGAGTSYFALALLRHLETLGVFILNPSRSVEIVKDKFHASQVLAMNGLPLPKTILVRHPLNTDLILEQFKFPVIIKTVTGSQGNGVFLSGSRSQFKDVMMLLDASNKTVDILTQEYISANVGCDLRVLVIGDRVISCMKRQAKEGEFKANISGGGSGHKFKIIPEIEELALRTTRALGLNVAGVDILIGESQYFICEANSSPGFRGMESCCQVNVPREIFNFIRYKINKQNG